MLSYPQTDRLMYENPFKNIYFWSNTQTSRNRNFRNQIQTDSCNEKYHAKTTQDIHKENFWDYLI
jgi:hypothetical protein